MASHIGPLKTSELVSRIVKLAQTSVYQIKLSPPTSVVNHLKDNGFDYGDDGVDLELRCDSAVLPGSSFSTHEVTGDYQGVRERMAYRRMYDDTVDLTFYVDKDYKTIQFFDGWFDYISCQGNNERLSNTQARTRAATYKFNYPNNYKTNMYVVKFEKDVSTTKDIFEHDDTYQCTYTLVNAFPLNLVSTPVSYEGSQALKYSVSMAFDRYTMDVAKVKAQEADK